MLIQVRSTRMKGTHRGGPSISVERIVHKECWYAYEANREQRSAGNTPSARLPLWLVSFATAVCLTCALDSACFGALQDSMSEESVSRILAAGSMETRSVQHGQT